VTSVSPERQLESRYRRILSFGDVLDESIGLFRRHWAVFALVSAVWLIPPGLVTVLVTASGAFSSVGVLEELASGVPPDLSSASRFAAALLLVDVVSALFYVGWTTAVLVTADDYVHAVEPRLGAVLARTLRRYAFVLLGGLVYGVSVTLLALVAAGMLTLYALALPVSLVVLLAIVAGGLVWALQPRARNTWLKWLLILATPFGLPVYFAGRWSMYLCAVVLEHQGPIRALRRSAQLVNRHWFRVVAILCLAALIVSIVQSAPTLLVQLPLWIGALLRGQTTLTAPELAASTAVGVVAQILFASMATIVYAMVFVDLRNRREGTDLAERLSQLEAQTAVPLVPPTDAA
jgi:hypothetical protein